VLALIADDDAHVRAIFDLDHATNDRLLAEHDRSLGIGIDELVFAVPGYRVINAAFAHPHPLGSRFNGPDRGAWYAAFAVETAQREVAFHKAVDLAEVNRFIDSVTYDDYVADLSAALHDLRDDSDHTACLDPESYEASQLLAERLLGAGSLGVIYSSVRDPGGTCVACFRPALVGNLRRGPTYRLVWHGSPMPTIELLSS
jgi:hypothetical protein